MLVTHIVKELRNIMVFNLYVQPDWKAEELQDFVDVVCWRIQAALSFDPAAGIIVGGDLNKKGMKELEPRLRRQGLIPVFGARAETHDRGGRLDEIFTNLKGVYSSITSMEGVSDHHMLMCELLVNPENQPQPTLQNKLLKPIASQAMIREKLESSEIESKIERGIIRVTHPIREAVLNLCAKQTNLPRLKAPKPAGFSVYDKALEIVDGEYAGCYLTRQAKQLLSVYEAQGKKLTPQVWKKMSAAMEEAKCGDMVQSIKFKDSQGVDQVTADKDEMDLHIRDKFETVFWNPDAEPIRNKQYEMRAVFGPDDARNAARLIKEKKALGMDCWSVK